MSDYVDNMDLATFGKDDEGQPTEYMPMDETYSPMLHRIHQVIKHRAVYPDTEPPPPYEILTRYSHPPEELAKRAQTALNSVIKAADVKKVPPKARGRRSGRKEAQKPLSDLDVGALLASDPKRKHKRIDPKNAVPEFRQLLESGVEMPAVVEAIKQMKSVIFDWIRHSVGNSGYGRAIEALRVIREEMAEMDEPSGYNELLKELKGKLLGGELGGGRNEMWYMVRVNRLGLIQQKEVDTGGVTEDEAKTFMSSR